MQTPGTEEEGFLGRGVVAIMAVMETERGVRAEEDEME